MPSSATYSVWAFANQMPKGNEVVDFGALGKPFRMHILLGISP